MSARADAVKAASGGSGQSGQDPRADAMCAPGCCLRFTPPCSGCRGDEIEAKIRAAEAQPDDGPELDLYEGRVRQAQDEAERWWWRP